MALSNPSEVQLALIPAALRRHELLVNPETGSGKLDIVSSSDLAARGLEVKV